MEFVAAVNKTRTLQLIEPVLPTDFLRKSPLSLHAETVLNQAAKIQYE